MRRLSATLIMVAFLVPCATAQDLPGSKRDFKFERKMTKLDLEDTAKYKFFFKSGGTSIGFKIAKKGGRKAGVFVPLNTSSYPEGEVVSYRLSRLLHVSNLYNPVDYYVLGPNAIDRFRDMLRDERNRWRRNNTDALQDRIDSDDQRLLGIYKFRHKRRSQSVNRLCDGNRLNEDHFLAKYLRASGPRPSTKRVRLRGITRDKKSHKRPRESERELARQLSIILVMDMLTGQWDRFSGGNVEAYAHKNGRLQFIARDNGGATLGSGWTWYERYARWVSRFDRAFVNRLSGLNKFLSGGIKEFSGFDDKGSLRKALGFRRNSSFENFKEKLQALAGEGLQELKEEYGDAVFFREPES